MRTRLQIRGRNEKRSQPCLHLRLPGLRRKGSGKATRQPAGAGSPDFAELVGNTALFPHSKASRVPIPAPLPKAKETVTTMAVSHARGGKGFQRDKPNSHGGEK